MESFELSDRAYTRYRLQDKYKKSGKDWHRRFKPLVVLPLKAEETPRPDVINAVHQDVLSLEMLLQSGYSTGLLHLKTRPLTEQDIQNHIRAGQNEGVVGTMTYSVGAKATEISSAETTTIVREHRDRMRSLK